MEEGRRIIARSAKNFKKMIIFLYGPDSYRRQGKLKEYIDRYRVKYPALSLNSFDLSREEEIGKLKDFSRAQSLFESSKLGTISNIAFLEGREQKDFIQILKENLETKQQTLIINEAKKPEKIFHFLMKEPVICHNFEDLAGLPLRDFFQGEANKRKLNFDKKSEDLLLGVYAGNSWGLVTELDKLALLNKGQINLDVLKNYTDALSPINIFSSLQQIRNAPGFAKKLPLLEELFSRNEDSPKIFNILSSFHGDSDWKNKLADYDAAVKSGKLEYEEVLLSLAIL